MLEKLIDLLPQIVPVVVAFLSLAKVYIDKMEAAKEAKDNDINKARRKVMFELIPGIVAALGEAAELTPTKVDNQIVVALRDSLKAFGFNVDDLNSANLAPIVVASVMNHNEGGK